MMNMPMLAELPLLAISVQNILNGLYVALGLGLVIFFHELGHFAVAKWCNVYVERFSIGFGPVLLSWKTGETEYALSAIPFGGYVKMLGQDDADPSQLTSEEVAADPRSYSAKSVLQRMTIISAGVIMNLITAVIFIAIAFSYGVKTAPSVIGYVQPGSPAWTSGLEDGDHVLKLNGRTTTSFSDIALGIALSPGNVELEGKKAGGAPFKLSVTPSTTGSRPQIGIAWPQGMKLIVPLEKGRSPTVTGSAAARAVPPLRGGDTIIEVGGKPIENYQAIQQAFSRRTGDFPPITVERVNGKSVEKVTIQIPNQFFRRMGLRMDAGPIVAIREGSPAAKAGLKVGDKLARISELNVGTEIDPLRLPDELARMYGQSIKVLVTRQAPGGPMKEEEVELVPEDRPAWIDPPNNEGDPVSIPAIGVAFQMIPVVLQVEPDSPAAVAGVTPQSRITSLSLVLPSGVTEDEAGSTPVDILFDDEKNPKAADNFPYAFWQMQRLPQRRVVLKVKDANNVRSVELQPIDDPSWQLPTAGMLLQVDQLTEKADDVGSAFAMAYHHTRRNALNIYATLRSLITGRLSVTELHGPLGIVKQAYDVTEYGMVPLLLFLGFLSINLAVLNFLPIPVLDGGHMVFLLWELVTRRKPSESVVIGATYAGGIFLLSLMVLVLYLDIFHHLLGFHK